MSLAGAARLGDPLTHTSAMKGLLFGALIGAALAIAILATGGLALVTVAAAAGAFCAGVAIGEALGSLSWFSQKAGSLLGSAGSPDVRINRKPAMRARVDQGLCKDHGRQLIAQGSDNIFINGFPAARAKDQLTCSAAIGAGSPDVLFGGGTWTTDDIQPEVPAWVHWTLGVVGMASAIIVTGGVVIPLLGVLGGLAGAEGGGWIGRRIDGAGSDAEKLGSLLGGLIGGLMGWKGGKVLLKRPALARRVDQRMNLAARQHKCRLFAGDPVDVVSGEVLMRQQDLFLPAALPLELERVHLSGFTAGRLFGPSWASTWDQRLALEGEGVRYLGPDGVVHEFALPEIGAESLDGRSGELLLLRFELGFMVVTAEGRASCFLPGAPGEARLSALIDRGGQHIDLSYAADGTLCQVRHSAGHSVRVQTEAGRVRVLFLDDPSEGAQHLLARYEYAGGQLGAVLNSSGLPLQYVYGEDGRIARWQDRRGTWVAYAYDAAGRCTATSGVDGIFNDRFDYDTAGRCTVHTDAHGARTTYHYNEHYQVIRRVDPLGGVQEVEWDEHDRKLVEVDALGRVTRFEYDAAGRLVRLTRPDDSSIALDYDGLGHCSGIDDPLGGRWALAHDARGFLVEATTPSDQTFAYERDAAGQLRGATDPSGAKATYQVDARGLTTAATDSAGAVTRTLRDAHGRVRTHIDAHGCSSEMAYTSEGRLQELRRSDGSRDTWGYDAEGVLESHCDPLGNVTRFETGWFDVPGAAVAADGSRIACEYDRALRLSAVTRPSGERWLYERDLAGRVVAETDFNGRRRSYRLDAAGQRIAATNALGEVVRFEYDELGRLKRRICADAISEYAYDACGHLVLARNAGSEVRFERDAMGRVVKESFDGCTLQSQFDGLGRRIERALVGAGARQGAMPSDIAWDSVDLDGRWCFDASGRPAALEFVNGEGFAFAHDASGRETERQWRDAGHGVRVTQAHDASGRMIRQSVDALAGRGARRLQHRSWTHDRAGQVRTEEDLTFGAATYAVDNLGRVTSVRGDGGEERCAYGASGDLLETRRRRRLFARSRAATVTQGQRRYRGSELEAAGDVSYRHDALGRVVERREPRGKVWGFVWTSEDRLASMTTPEGEVWHYRYDALGRRLTKQRVEPGNTRAAKGSPAAGERVMEEVRFLWDGHVLAAEIAVRREHARDGSELRDKRSVRTTTWEWLPESFVPLAQTVSTCEGGRTTRQRYAVVTDAIGTPRELVAADGRIVWQASTTLWGELDDVRVEQVVCPFAFQGQYRDTESGLAYNLHRYYDPATARYLSGDPLGLAGGLDPHAYVRNPTGWTDPLGLMGCPKGGWKNVAVVRQYQNTDLKHRIFSVEIANGKTYVHKAMVFLDNGWEIVDGDQVISSFQGLRQIRAQIPLADPEAGIAYLHAGVPSDRSTSWGYVVGALKASGVEIGPHKGPAFLRGLGFNMRKYSELDPDRTPDIWKDFDPFRNAGKDGGAGGLLDGDNPFTGPVPGLSDN